MSSPPASAGPLSPISNRKSKRKRVRNATFILPSGERINRQITLRNQDFAGNGPILGEVNSLLPIHDQQHVDRWLPLRDKATKSWTWVNSSAGRSVLKCSFAYVIGSLAVFVPQVSNYLGQQDGKHMVATVTCYFNPARSAGGMAEGIFLGLAAFVYAVFICFGSMATAVVCDSFGLIELGYILVLLVFCGGGLGLVGWVKQKLNGPLASVACSLASLAIITVITKESAVQTGVFSDDKITQVLKMVLMGMATTSAVCLLVWPISARSELRQTMIQVTDSFGEMLIVITRSFLSGSEADLQSPQFEDTASRYKTVFNQLSKNLKEAKFEHYILGTEDEYAVEKKLVGCMRKLAQAVGGLRSAAATQFTLLSEKGGGSTPANARQYSIPQIHPSTISASVRNKQDRFAVLSAIDEVPDEWEDDDSVSPLLERSSSFYSASGLPTVRTPAEIFERFILHLGPSVKSLAYTLSEILKELPFGEKPRFKITINEHFTTSLTDALELYGAARAQALEELYKSKELLKDRPEQIEADFEEVAASCGHFSFSLQDIAEEMQNYLEILNQLKEEVETPYRRSWKWLLFWRKWKSNQRLQIDNRDPEREPLIHNNAFETYRALDLPDVKLHHRQFQPYEVPAPRSFRKWVLDVTRVLRRDDIRFAIKVGIGAALWAMFSFIPETRPFYRLWRGEWGLISYMLVCAMTVGASNTTGIGRFLGTCSGAILSVLVWFLCQGNPFALVFMGWVVSLPCFYIIIALNKGPMGRFILLTYNLSCLYAYSLSVKEGQDDEDEGGSNPIITEIALHRLIATMGGCLWGLFITRVIWPISARQKLKGGLSILWLRMGLIWKRDPLSVLIEDKGSVENNSNVYMNLEEEYALQKYVSKLENLRGSATSEFELRGPFREKQYSRILASTSRMLDSFHAMNVVMMNDFRGSEGELAILRYTAEERAELCKRISHLFQVMASSMKLEFPLNDALPSTYNARDRLLAKIFHFRKTEEAEEVKDEDYALLYAFALVTGQLGEEIAKVGVEIEGLFGVLDEEVLELR